MPILPMLSKILDLLCFLSLVTNTYLPLKNSLIIGVSFSNSVNSPLPEHVHVHSLFLSYVNNIPHYPVLVSLLRRLTKFRIIVALLNIQSNLERTFPARTLPINFVWVIRNTTGDVAEKLFTKSFTDRTVAPW